MRKQEASETAAVNAALESAIHIGLAALLTISCPVILWPFIPMLAWGIIIAVAAYPAFKKLQRAVGGRAVLAAVLFTLAFLAVLIIPTFLLAGSLMGACSPSLATSVPERLSCRLLPLRCRDGRLSEVV